MIDRLACWLFEWLPFKSGLFNPTRGFYLNLRNFQGLVIDGSQKKY